MSTKELNVKAKNIVANAYESSINTSVVTKEVVGNIPSIRKLSYDYEPIDANITFKGLSVNTTDLNYQTGDFLNIAVSMTNVGDVYVPIPGIFEFYENYVTYSETISLGVGKSFSESTIVSEVTSLQFDKVLENSFTVSEEIYKQYAKALVDTKSFAEDLFLLKQNYFLEDYIAEDYVGDKYIILSITPPPPSTLTVELDPNYINPLGVLSNNNMTYTWNWVGSSGRAYGNIAKNSGKQYFEVINEVAGGYGGAIYDNWAFNAGVSTSKRAIGNDIIVGLAGNGQVPGSFVTASTFHNSVSTFFYDTQRVAQGEALGVAVDFDTGKIWFSIDGRWLYDQDPDLGGEPHLTFTPNITLYPAVGVGSYDPFQSSTLNAGSLPFMGVKPAGFESWNSSTGVAS